MKLRFRSGTAREILAISGAVAALITLRAQVPRLVGSGCVSARAGAVSRRNVWAGAALESRHAWQRARKHWCHPRTVSIWSV